MTHQVQPSMQGKKLPPITEADRTNAANVIKKAKVQLAINHPFFAQIVLGRKIEISDNISTAHINNRGKITVGTRFAASLKVQQGVFLLAHEAMHYAMLHLLRRKYRDPRKWNVACDAVINDLLTTAKVGEFIDGGVNMTGSKDKTSEKVYEELPDQGGGKGKGKGGAGKQQGQGQGGSGQGDGDYQPGEGWDDLQDDEKLDESEVREVEEQVRQELAQAAAVAKQQGHMPAGMERLIDEIINPKTPWYILLERYMTSFVKADYSWRRPNRRHFGNGFYLPSSDKVPRMGTVVVVVDTSGSIGPELPHFLGHINTIMSQCRPEKIVVMHCDAQVHEAKEYEMHDLPIIIKQFKGGGGTSFKPPFAKVEKMGLEPEVLVYLTDMYGDFPTKAPEYNTVWLSTTKDMKAPFGDVIYYECENQK
jgi:predicted metal-dependent peptidase